MICTHKQYSLCRPKKERKNLKVSCLYGFALVGGGGRKIVATPSIVSGNQEEALLGEGGGSWGLGKEGDIWTREWEAKDSIQKGWSAEARAGPH